MEKTDLAEGSRADAELLARAQAGDGDAFREVTEPFRRKIHVHCYRILGSVQDAEDALQETMVAACRPASPGSSTTACWPASACPGPCPTTTRATPGRRQTTDRPGPPR